MKIKAQKLTAEAFAPFGAYTDLLHPAGYSLGAFYADRLLMDVSGALPVAFSPLSVDKPERYVVTAAEYHNTTAEGILPLDADVVIHVAPPSAEPVPELTQAFLVPRGTLVRLNVGVWHLCALPVDQPHVNILIVLPQRIYKNDCVVVQYAPEQHIEIEL